MENLTEDSSKTYLSNTKTSNIMLSPNKIPTKGMNIIKHCKYDETKRNSLDLSDNSNYSKI